MRYSIVTLGITILCSFILLVGCRDDAPSEQNVQLFAASSLTNAFTDLGKAYETSHGTPVLLSFGASSQLATQIIEGAQADLFASADDRQMARVVRAGRIRGDPVHFASTRLALIVPRANRAGIGSLRDIARPGIKIVTTNANVPIGRYTHELLTKLEQAPGFPEGYREDVLANVVSEEANARQLRTKIQLGEADAAFVYSSDISDSLLESVRVLEVPDQYNVQARYLVALVVDGNAPEEAADLLDFMLSPEGQIYFERRGFQVP